ncbi:MAG: hypothetical protein WDN09_01265 [bacterium]
MEFKPENYENIVGPSSQIDPGIPKVETFNEAQGALTENSRNVKFVLDDLKGRGQFPEEVEKRIQEVRDLEDELAEITNSIKMTSARPLDVPERGKEIEELLNQRKEILGKIDNEYMQIGKLLQGNDDMLRNLNDHEDMHDEHKDIMNPGDPRAN